MLTHRTDFRALGLAGLALTLGLFATPVVARAAEPATAKLFLKLDAKYNTPDGMALLPSGDMILSMPNLNDTTPGAYLLKISKTNEVSEFMQLPKHPVTGKLVGALGVCVAPSGDLFLADYQSVGERQSRVLRVVVKDGRAVDLVPVITGFHVSNAVIVRDGYLYVSETQIDTKSVPATSGVFRFKLDELNGKPVELAADEPKDPHCLGVIEVHNKELPLGADGLCFDKQGNLYCGNFTDGTVHQFKFGAGGKVVSNKIFARAECMKSSDGLMFDPVKNVIYVADSRANAIQIVSLDGKVTTLAANGDTDGADGGMDQPCETLLRGRELIVSNMDWPVPGTVNTKYDPLATLSVIDVK